MANVKRVMTGVPYHLEHLHKKEDDDRRHRARCMYYNGKDTSYCSYYCGKCRGSAHCIKYRERVCFSTDEIDKELILQQGNSKKQKFEGIKYISIDEITYDSKIASNPSDSKVQKIIKYYKENGELDKPIVVECDGNSYKLKDKYLRYYVAKKLNLVEIPAEMGTKDEVKERDKLREIGTLVWHKKYSEVGEIIAVTLQQVTIRFDNSKVQNYDIHKCLRMNTIRVL